jgi:Protein of unknown function (DUF1153)
MCDDALFFIGQDGKQVKLGHLPASDRELFRPRHKAMVVAAVRHGLITVDEACRRYNLSTEGYLNWYQCYALQLPADADDRV